MDRSIPMFLIGLVFGGGIGFVTAAVNGVTLDGHNHDHGDASQYGHGAGHESAMTGDEIPGHDHDDMVSLPPGTSAPSLNVAIVKDPVAGWNLHVVPTNFVFSPRNAGTAHVPGEGHAHVYVNGKKIARLYGPWMHLSGLESGSNTVDVTLNSNDHRQLAVSGVPIRASITVDVE